MGSGNLGGTMAVGGSGSLGMGTIGILNQQLTTEVPKVAPQTFYQNQNEYDDDEDSDPAEFDSDGMPANPKNGPQQ